MSIKTESARENSDHHPDLMEEQRLCLLAPGESLRPGMICPRCRAARLDYNGLLHLVCPNCGLTEIGAYT